MNNVYINLLTLPPPGLLAIEENDLGNKVAKIVPDPFKHQYTKLLDAAVPQEKKRRKAKNAKAADSKKMKQQKIYEFNKRLQQSESDILV